MERRMTGYRITQAEVDHVNALPAIERAGGRAL